MPEPGTMRDRVQTGNVLVFIFLIVGLLSLWWNSATARFSLWWLFSMAVVVGSVILFGKGLQLVLSGFSGFGRNFHEHREPLDPSPNDDSYVHTTAVNGETAGALGFPMVLMLFGGLTLLVRLFPAMNVIPESEGTNFVPTRFLTPLILAFGSILTLWSVLLRVMMKTGTDRWDFVPGARDQIRSYTRVFFVFGVLLVVFAVVSLT
jgi:hypothetical protein